MSIFKTKRLTFITIVYWFLLLYIVAALVWWFISLQQQNESISQLRLNALKNSSTSYNFDAGKILDERGRKTAQYIGEGLTFFILIMVGAVFVYRATRRQIRLSLQQQNFMMAVTHELKTPIAISRLNLETLQKRKLEEQQQQKLISNTLQEVNRLNSLSNNILLASQLDAGSYKIAKKDVDISALGKRVIRDFQSRHPQRKIDGRIDEDVHVTGEELLLEMLINNLVENAIKYSSKETPVNVILETENSNIVLSVIDEGPGVPEDEKSKIFDKFYRVGNEATRNAKGTGLGLYLCKKIAEDHGAEIKVHNNLKGAVFTVVFKP